MPVVINEFEVVGDQPPDPRPESTAQEAPPSTQRGATPHDVESILRREKERLARVQAH
jgi:hypothetical protein